MEDIKDKIQLFEDFQKEWNLERISNMKIEEYTSIQKDNPNRDDFTYWLESKLDGLGSIWGGSAFKFGIYKRSDTSKKESQNGRTYNENYAWLTRYGKNETEAFYNVKDKIIQIIKASQNNRLEDIEKIDFGDAVKWKIAFHYQNINNIKIVNIFSKNVLNLIASGEIKEKLKIYQIYEKLLKDKNLSLGEMIEQISIPLWVKYGEGSQIYLEKMKELFCEYLKSNRKLNQDDIDKYNQTINEISSLYFKKSLYQCTKFEFSKNLEELKKNQYFMAKYNDKNGIYLKTLEYYEEFLRNHFEEEIMEIKMQNVNLPLNQILYGPPGTGKTYHAINKALEILDYKKDVNTLDYDKIEKDLESFKIDYKKDDENQQERNQAKALFDYYVKKGQIVFITFHQSYGYEEFVEGIKPVVDSEQGNSKEVEYEIKDGVFKELCGKALDNYDNSILNIDELNEKIELKEKVENFLNWILETNEPIGKTKGGNFFVVEIDDKTIVIHSEGVERFDGIFNLNLSIFMELLKCKDKFNNATEMFKKVFNRDYADRTHTYYFNLVKKFKAYEKQLTAKIENNKNNDNSLKHYIIIVDEINRGNVSKIFGELITLIEPSKRIGESEELKVILPYSGEKFGVPKNVYIIGTMNTADRSITSLDTALRRRFEFVEMMPNASKLSTNFEGIDLQKLLEAINVRIEYLLDREKTIGHAFFMDVKNLEDLKNVFQNKIIPLLQEYFYNDYALIEMVLNKNGMLGAKQIKPKEIFPKSYLEFEEKVVYEVLDFQDEKWTKPKIYRDIYSNADK